MLSGSYVALVTPFKNNEIDYNATELLLEDHLDKGTDGILLCGTTGESPSLAGDEKESFVRFCLQKCQSKIPVMMGTGTNNLIHTISATVKAKAMGVDFALVITPYYNKPTQTGLYDFFKTVATNVDLPIVIYNVPGRTGVNISSETVCRLANDFPSIVGIKEASGDLIQITEIIRDAPDDFSVLSGEDALNFPILASGGQGVISVTANIVPSKIKKLVVSCLKGNFKEAQKLHLDLMKLNRILFIETNPIPVKEALAHLKKIELEFRPPMSELCQENRDILLKTLAEYKLS